MNKKLPLIPYPNKVEFYNGESFFNKCEIVFCKDEKSFHEDKMAQGLKVIFKGIPNLIKNLGKLKQI